MKAFILLAALLASGSAAGQVPSLAGQPTALASVPALTAAPDTVAALHQLFAARRQRRSLIAIGSVGAALVGTAATPTKPGDLLATSDFAKLYGLGAAIIILVDFVFGDIYSRKNEQRAVASFEAHQLSRHLKRRLKARYFR